MNKKFSKICALATSLVASLGMGCVSYAATIDNTGKAETPTGDNTITIARELELNSSDGGTVYAPAITYTYELSAGDATTEGDIEIKAGDVSYLASGSKDEVKSIYTNEDYATSGDKVNKPISFTFDPAAFPSAGVYRYKLNETATSVNPTDIGITRDADYDTEKFLDVYVTNDNGNKIITGYVLIKDLTPTKVKSSGWVESYNTYTLTVTKHITGTLADKTAQFPFQITFSGEMSSSKMELGAGTGSSIIMSAITPGLGTTDDTRDVTGNLGNGETIIITGIPTTVKINVGEKNPTDSAYNATATGTGVTGGTLVTNEKIDKQSSNYVAVATDLQKTDIIDDAEIVVTNNLDSPSPTGVILYFAPYILIGGLAVLLLVISVKSKKRVQA